ncbi:DUF4157 domain-containing protein [Rubrolithibacter danxiaensis]|uniref:eCIS core domain-containing protein n=1 Tax=Rubrolithibacter danxiaensis TaxID=3390805 RepID=UPI003BF82924
MKDVISADSATFPAAHNSIPLSVTQSFSFPVKKIQRKLTVGAPDDEFEKEADRAAETIMRMPQPSFLQRKCAACEEDEKLNRKPLTSFVSSRVQRKEWIQKEDDVQLPPDLTPNSSSHLLKPEELRLTMPSLSGFSSSSPAFDYTLSDPAGSIDWFAMNQPFWNRAAGNMPDRDRLAIEKHWTYSFNMFRAIGATPEKAIRFSNILVPMAIDSSLKRDNSTWWERTDSELGTSSKIFSPTIFRFDLDNLFRTFRPAWDSSNTYRIQRKTGTETCGTFISNELQNRIESCRGKGGALDESSKSFMEHAFNADFSGINIHSDSESAKLTQELNAQAFTVGSDIYFNEGKYAPASADGKALLAHELTHTIQQNAVMPLLQRKTPGRHPGDFEKCISQKDRVLPPATGLIEQINREVQLDTMLGTERTLLEEQVKLDEEARKFVCEAGVPALAALYDTRNAGIKLEADCARRALMNHPEHYSFSNLNKPREEVIPVAYASFANSTPLVLADTGKTVSVDPGRQLRIISETPSEKGLLVRVISGSQHCMEGYIKTNRLEEAKATSLKDTGKVILVFVQNPERLGENLLEIKTGLSVRDTKLQVDEGNGKNHLFKIPRNTHFTLGSEDLHTATHFMAHIHFETGLEIWGLIPKKDVTTDTKFRSLQRTFFVRDVGLSLANARKSIFVDPVSGTCSAKHLPIEFFTGKDIAKGISIAAACAGKPISEVHIVGHGGAHGMGGTGNADVQNGIYVEQVSVSMSKLTALTAADFVKATKNALANDVRIWLHACRTAETLDKNVPGFAQQLGRSIRVEGEHTASKVGGLLGRGPANKGIDRVYPFILFPSGDKEWFPK